MVEQADIASLVHDLAEIVPDGDDIFNQYLLNDDKNNAIRRANFELYLHDMAQRQPKVMMVMEAPGYRGSRLTGVPVTSRKILLKGVPVLGMFGEENGYQNVDDAGFENVYGEQSATIVWNTLTELERVPLIWNTFPFHPRKAGKPRSNRRPRRSETDIGATFIRCVVSLFRPEVIIAVGNVAHETMMIMGINCVKVRHPAQGGKKDFVNGITALLS